MDARHLIFLDETGTSLSLVAAYGWARAGERAIGQAPTGHRRHHTLLSTLTPTGMGPALLVEGAADRRVMETFVEQHLVPLLGPGQIVVLDNASVHQRTRLRQVVEDTGAQLRFLPKYSPDFTPIELAFANMKTGLRRAAARTPERLLAATKTALNSITEQDARRYYRHAGYLLPEQLL